MNTPDESRIKSISIQNLEGALSVEGAVFPSLIETIRGRSGDLIQSSSPSSEILAPPPRPRRLECSKPSTLNSLSQQLQSTQPRASPFLLRWLDRFDRVGILATVPEGQKESSSDTGSVF